MFNCFLNSSFYVSPFISMTAQSCFQNNTQQAFYEIQCKKIIYKFVSFLYMPCNNKSLSEIY